MGARFSERRQGRWEEERRGKHGEENDNIRDSQRSVKHGPTNAAPLSGIVEALGDVSLVVCGLTTKGFKRVELRQSGQ